MYCTMRDSLALRSSRASQVAFAGKPRASRTIRLYQPLVCNRFGLRLLEPLDYKAPGIDTHRPGFTQFCNLGSTDTAPGSRHAKSRISFNPDFNQPLDDVALPHQAGVFRQTASSSAGTSRGSGTGAGRLAKHSGHCKKRTLPSPIHSTNSFNGIRLWHDGQEKAFMRACPEY